MYTEIEQVKNLMSFLNSVDIGKVQSFSEFNQPFVNKFIENYENIFGEKISFDFNKKMKPLVRYIGKCGLKSNSHNLSFSFGASHVVYDTEINELFAGTIVDSAFHYFEFKNNSLNEFIFDKTIIIDLGLNAALKKHNGKQNILKQEIVVNKILNKTCIRNFLR